MVSAQLRAAEREVAKVHAVERRLEELRRDVDDVVIQAVVNTSGWGEQHEQGDAASMDAEDREGRGRAPPTFELLTTADLCAARCTSRGVNLALQWVLETVPDEGEFRAGYTMGGGTPLSRDSASVGKHPRFDLTAEDSDDEVSVASETSVASASPEDFAALGCPFSFG